MCMSVTWLAILGLVLFVAFMVVVFESDGRKWENGKHQSLDTYYRKKREREKADELERMVKRWQ